MINNAFYNELKEGWYTAKNHPVALLRAENRLRVPWIAQEIKKKFKKKTTILDVGCGAGFLCNALAKEGHIVFGVDLSETSLAVAQAFDETKLVDYRCQNCYNLSFPSEIFDVVTAMDVLEHVEDPGKLIQEAARVLKPGGLFFFHTFNRNFLSYLMVIKGVEWFVKNTPPNMHVYPLFIKPEELTTLCSKHKLKVNTLKGVMPNLFSRSFFQLLRTKVVPEDFSFTFCKNLRIGYSGIAQKL